MSAAKIERRLSQLEAEVADLKAKLGTSRSKKGWWNEISGAFADDPAFKQAMKLGRQYRESLRPKSTRHKGRNGRS